MRTKFFIALMAAFIGFAQAAHAQAQNANTPKIWLTGGSGNTAPKTTVVDPSKPVARGYITVDAEPAIGGANVTVETFQSMLSSPVLLSLQCAIRSQNGQTYILPIKVISQGVSDPNSYYHKETMFISYHEIQDYFDRLAPHAGLKVEPGMAMFVKADFFKGQNGGWDHNWGGYDRGGVFFLPTPKDQNGRLMVELNNHSHQQQNSSAPRARATALDIAYPLVQEMANTYNDRATGAGLKVGGQVRSRVEGEGKFQVPDKVYGSAKAALFRLAADPTEATRILGPGWTIKLEDRYMKRDANNNLILGADGLPVPDPMVDTYYDSPDYRAAQNDMAIRYRWTEGNATGSWNFKPGIGRTDANGTVYRVEYGVDTTDDHASSLAKFADSMHPLNPFQAIRTTIPGSAPSDFLHPAVKITDTRYKFKLEHSSGLIIEVSADEVAASDLRHGNADVHYKQIEMDIDHLATASTNVVAGATGGIQMLPGNDYNGRWKDDQAAIDGRLNFLKGLDQNAMFDGRPVLHDASDVEGHSPLLMSRAGDFQLAGQAIQALRDHTLGPNWRPGAQKYAFAASALGLVSKGKESQSVKKIDDMIPEARQPQVQRQQGRLRNFIGRCSVLFR